MGRRGLWVTYGKRGRRTTVGLPGTGISYTTTSKAPGGPRARSGSGAGLWLLWLLLVLVLIAYFSRAP